MPLVIDAARSSNCGSTPEHGPTSTHAHRQIRATAPGAVTVRDEESTAEAHVLHG